MPLCDTVLRLAAAELFEPYWSETILEEVRRNLVEDGRSSISSATARIAMMRVHFPEAIVYGHDSLIPAMTNHPKDRHVLAAAVKAGADQRPLYEVVSNRAAEVNVSAFSDRARLSPGISVAKEESGSTRQSDELTATNGEDDGDRWRSCENLSASRRTRRGKRRTSSRNHGAP